MKTVKEYLTDMLRENTGKHFLDSGGAYGRNWERNQDKDFESEPRVWYDIINNGIDYTVSTFHYLSEILDVDQFSETVNMLIDIGMWCSDEDAVKELLIRATYQNDHYVGYEWEVFETVNTYNYENCLSQVLLFTVFKLIETGDVYVLLQIHGGCDVRGGYTDVKCFKLNGYLTGNPDVYGGVNGVDVDNCYNGYELTDETGERVKLINDKNNISLDFIVNENCYY